MPRSSKARVFWPVLLALLVADCATKQLAETYLTPEHVPHQVAGSVVRFTLAHNPGAAMSLSLGRYSRIGFTLAALLALVVLAQLYVRTPATHRLRAAALALVVGGALGNLLNRWVSPRGVTDFIDVGVRTWRFYTFNLADAGVSIGAVLLIVILSREGSGAPGAGSGVHPPS
jgi:signal peptidase II